MPFNCINYNVWTFTKGRHPPGSLPSEISVALPPRKLQTCLAAAISSSEAATPFHRNRPLGHFSTNTSLVFSLDAVGSTWLRREREKESERKIIAWWSSLTVSMYMPAVNTDLHSACCTGGALADMEKACIASLTLTTFTWSPTHVDDHGFPLEQAHQMGWFLALSDTYLQSDITVNSKPCRFFYFLQSKLFSASYKTWQQE